MSTRVEDGLSWSSGSSVRSEKNPEAPKLVDILVAFAVSSAASPEIVKSWPQDALPRLVKIEASEILSEISGSSRGAFLHTG